MLFNTFLLNIRTFWHVFLYTDGVICKVKIHYFSFLLLLLLLLFRKKKEQKSKIWLDSRSFQCTILRTHTRKFYALSLAKTGPFWQTKKYEWKAEFKVKSEAWIRSNWLSILLFRVISTLLVFVTDQTDYFFSSVSNSGLGRV